jgi:hypothetical protein
VKRAIAAGGAAALAARGAYAALRRWPPGGAKTWTQTNHRGELVTLLEGPAVAVGAVAAQLARATVTGAAPARPLTPPAHPKRTRAFALSGPCPSGSLAALPPGFRETGFREPGYRPPAARGDLAVAVAGLGALGFGVLDDLRGSGQRRGLRGHLGALAHGEVTTGTVKLAGLAATGLAAALLDPGTPAAVHPGAGRRRAALPGAVPGGAGPAGNAPRAGRTADVLVNAGLIAGGANLLNLFDLRPGRAIKVAVLSAGLITAGGRGAGLDAIAVPVGAALALLPDDLGERAMLGDAGANALGAMLGAAAARALPGRARLGLLAAMIALTAASEKVSFTRVIAATPALNWLDMAGRRPPAPAGPAPAGPVPGTAPLSAPVPASPDEPRARRRRPGRHPRMVTRVSRSRPGAWGAGLVTALVRQEP